MRKLPLLILITALALPLPADAFLSNALGQDLGAIEGLTGSGYEGEREGSATRIYLDGELIRERIDDGSGGYTIRADGTVETVSAEDGVRVSRTIDDGSSVREYRYAYDGGRLRSVAYSVDGTLVSMTEYVETPSGDLVGLAGTEEGYFTPGYYLYIRDGEAIRAEYHSQEGPAEAIPSGYTLSDDGTWHGTSIVDGREVRRVYSPEGLLLSQDDGAVSISFTYDEDGDMASSLRTEGDRTLETVFSDGGIASERRSVDGELVSERVFRSDGLIEETRYRDGSPYARILLDRDGLRVLEVENLQ